MRVFSYYIPPSVAPAIVGLVYSVLLSYSDLFFGFSFDSVKDRVNYQAYFDLEAFSLFEKFGLNLIFLEPGFVLFMAILSIPFDSSVLTVRALIAISSFIFAFSLVKIERVPTGIKMLILIFPWVLANYIMTLRQGLALSLFMYAYFHGSRNAKVLVYCIVPLIHYLFWIVVGLIGLLAILKRVRVSVGIAFVCILAAISFAIIILFFAIFNYDLFGKGELQSLLALYRERIGFHVGFGWLFWFVVFLLFGSQRFSFIRDNYLSFAFLALYLIWMPFFPPISRVMQVGAPIILLAAFGEYGLSFGRRILLTLMMVLHVIYFVLLSIESGGPGGMIL